jgi:hypothetical protein
MTTESLLDNNILQQLRQNNTITESEVVMHSGDLYYAKNVLTNEKRMISASLINNLQQNESIQVSNTKTLLKG